MRTMLIAALLCGVLSLSPVGRAAERPAGKRPGGERGAQMMQEMAEKLGLTEQQKEKLKPIRQEQGERMKEVFGDANLSREQKMEKMKAINEEFEPKIKAILTPEQVEKYQKIREEMRSGAGERGGRIREQMQEMTEKLGLTDAQKEKLKPIWQEQGEKMKEIFGSADLSREQKMEKMKAVREEFAPKFKEVLTPEQFEKWQKMREEMRGKIGERAKQRRGGAEKK